MDLNSVAGIGVELVGRLVGRSGHRAQFSGSFAAMCTSADLKQQRLLDRIDEYTTEYGLDAELGPAERPTQTRRSRAALDLDLRGVATIVWATGFRPKYPWLDDAHRDARGRLIHDGGVLATPGVYVLGLPFLRRRKSSFLDGVGPDAQELVEHLMQTMARI